MGIYLVVFGRGNMSPPRPKFFQDLAANKSLSNHSDASDGSEAGVDHLIPSFTAPW